MLNIVDYSSSEDSEEDNSNAIDSQPITNNKNESDGRNTKQALPLPDDIKQLFNKVATNKHDNPTEHDGRIRSFPHEEGNWATLICANYDTDVDDFVHLQQELFKCLMPHEMKKMEDYHVSLSRTVTIRHHWIQDISDVLKKEFVSMEGCCCEIDGIKVLVNDEKTRSFVVLTVSAADDFLQQYVTVVDDCFKEYNLQKYYQPATFHVSIGWCVGDITENISSKTKLKLQNILDEGLQESSDLKYFFIDEILMKTGNKKFVFKLEGDAHKFSIT